MLTQRHHVWLPASSTDVSFAHGRQLTKQVRVHGDQDRAAVPEYDARDAHVLESDESVEDSLRAAPGRGSCRPRTRALRRCRPTPSGSRGRCASPSAGRTRDRSATAAGAAGGRERRSTGCQTSSSGRGSTGRSRSAPRQTWARPSRATATRCRTCGACDVSLQERAKASGDSLHSPLGSAQPGRVRDVEENEGRLEHVGAAKGEANE